MMAKELRITAENRPGVLARIGAALASEGVNIRAILAYGEGGIIRLVVSDPGKARAALAKKDLPCEERDVVTVMMPNRPGALGTLSKKLGDAGVNIDYTYGTANGDESLLVFGVDDPKKANELIEQM